MYKHAMFQIAHVLPKVQKGNIAQVKTIYGIYTGMIVEGVAGQYSYVSILTGHRVFEASSTLSWDTILSLREEGVQVLAVWKSIKEWCLDGSPF